MVDHLGDIPRALDRANPRELAELYDALRLAVDYDHRHGWLKSRPRLSRVVNCVSEDEHAP